MPMQTRNFADSAVTAAKMAADGLTGVKTATVADANTVGGIPVVYRVKATALTGDVDVVVAEKIRVSHVVTVNAGGAGGAGDTITVKNGATAITDAIDCNKADKVVTRVGTINDAQHEIAAAGTLRVTGASAVTADVYIYAFRVA